MRRLRSFKLRAICPIAIIKDILKLKMKSQIASALVATYVAAQENLDNLTWSYCEIDQYDWACNIFCEDQRSFDWITQSQMNLACKWREAATQTIDTTYRLCTQGDADWCAYCCTDAENGNPWYSLDGRQEYACSNNTPAEDTEHDYTVEEVTTLWDLCNNQLQSDVCAYICEDQIDFLLTSSALDKACLWSQAAYNDEYDIY